MNVRTPSPARDTDPVTSHWAAESVDPFVASQVHAAVLKMLQANDLTDEELCAYYTRDRERYGWPPQAEGGPRKRRAELVAAGWVEAGYVVFNSRDRRVTVWRLTPAGREAVRLL